MGNVPNLNGGGNDPSGGSPPSGGGGSGPAPVNLSLLPVTGGLLGTQAVLLAIGFDELAGQNLTYQLDPSNFNCEEDVEYDFRIEEVEPGNQITIHNVLIRYRDIGVVTFIVAITSDLNPAVNLSSSPVNAKQFTVGNQVPTFRIKTLKTDLQVTTEAPQIKIIRKAKQGPLCITKVRAWGSYGDGDII